MGGKGRGGEGRGKGRRREEGGREGGGKGKTALWAIYVGRVVGAVRDDFTHNI